MLMFCELLDRVEHGEQVDVTPFVARADAVAEECRRWASRLGTSTDEDLRAAVAVMQMRSWAEQIATAAVPLEAGDPTTARQVFRHALHRAFAGKDAPPLPGDS